LGNAELPSKKASLYESSRESLERAIQLDPYNGWAYAELGIVLDYWDRDSAAARRNYQISIKLMPNDLNVYEHYFHHEYHFRNCAKAENILAKMKRINPKYEQPFNGYDLILLQCEGKYAEIAAMADEYDLEECSVWVLRKVMNAYLYTQNQKKVGEVVELVKNKVKNKAMVYTFEGLRHAVNGDRALALAMIDSLRALSSKEFVCPTQIAKIYAAVGDEDSMYQHLNIALEGRFVGLRNIENTSLFYPYRNDPRFIEIQNESWRPIKHGD
jgi:tetratricopeptide (TPR) repeat protein